MTKPNKPNATRVTPGQNHVRHHSQRKIVWVFASLLIVSFAVIASLPENIPLNQTKAFSIQLPKLETTADAVQEKVAGENIQWKDLIVKPGDSLERILLREKFSSATIDAIMSSGSDAKRLKYLHPGQLIQISATASGDLKRLRFSPDKTTSLDIKKILGKFTPQLTKREYDVQLRYAEGRIENALFLAGLDAGLSDNVIMKLINLFAWDIDFVLDIREGDSFKLLYEEYYLDGEKIKDGNIVAADFVNRGKTYSVFQYINKNGVTDYFAEDGRSIRREFLRTPVAFTRISSRFNLKRKHPVLHTIRAHRGVDYAAPRGTPIKAAGDGTIIYSAKKGGYGNVVEIKHGQKYTTLYAHMKSFGRGIRKGKKVKQGQTIGYVGSSGLATGPHLHYEFRVNGRHKNPLSVPLPKAPAINSESKDAFLASTESLRAKLGLLSEVHTIAQNQYQ